MIFFIWVFAVRSDVSHCQCVRMLSTHCDFHLFLLFSLEYSVFAVDEFAKLVLNFVALSPYSMKVPGSNPGLFSLFQCGFPPDNPASKDIHMRLIGDSKVIMEVR